MLAALFLIVLAKLALCDVGTLMLNAHEQYEHTIGYGPLHLSYIIESTGGNIDILVMNPGHTSIGSQVYYSDLSHLSTTYGMLTPRVVPFTHNRVVKLFRALDKLVTVKYNIIAFPSYQIGSRHAIPFGEQRLFG